MTETTIKEYRKNGKDYYVLLHVTAKGKIISKTFFSWKDASFMLSKLIERNYKERELCKK